MESIELASYGWICRGWLLVLAFTASILVVAAMRKPWRRAFGAGRAFQLWLLPPLAVLSGQLPHAATAAAASADLPSIVLMVTSAAATWSPSTATTAAIGWPLWLLLIWAAGTGLLLLSGAHAQWRYRMRLRDAVPDPQCSSRWPVLRARDASVGPALVGAWHARIVLPVDFGQRYDAIEQALVLAHEEMHARRGDGWWCLAARTAAAVFWFHPLAWWALAAFRMDQELACDAAVMREHGDRRFNYARAMLKTQSTAFALPVGCPWSPRHPVTERIALLGKPASGKLRNKVGQIAGAALIVVVASSAYATSVPPQTTPQPSATRDGNPDREYQLDMHVEWQAEAADRTHIERASLALCAMPGKIATVSTPGWKVKASATPEGRDRLRVDLSLLNSDQTEIARTVLHGQLGRPLHRSAMALDGKHRYTFDVTPQAGCPARAGAAKTASRSSSSRSPMSRSAARSDRFALDLALAAGGQPERLHASSCLRPGQSYDVTERGAAGLPPWRGRFSVVPAARGELEVQAELSGGSLRNIVHPRIRMLPGQTGTIQVGERQMGTDGTLADHTIRIDLTPGVGC